MGSMSVWGLPQSQGATRNWQQQGAFPGFSASQSVRMLKLPWFTVIHKGLLEGLELTPFHVLGVQEPRSAHAGLVGSLCRPGLRGLRGKPCREIGTHDDWADVQVQVDL